MWLITRDKQHNRLPDAKWLWSDTASIHSLCKRDSNHSCSHPQHQSFLPCWIPKREGREKKEAWGTVECGNIFYNMGIEKKCIPHCLSSPALDFCSVREDGMRPSGLQMMHLCCSEGNTVSVRTGRTEEAHSHTHIHTSLCFLCKKC